MREKCARATAWLRSRSRGSGFASHEAKGFGILDLEPSKSEIPDLCADRVRTDRQGSPVKGRFDARIAEPLPGGGQGHNVACRVGVCHRRVRDRRSAKHACPALGGFDQPFELPVVAVLGRSEQPVDRTQADREAQPAGDVLSRNGSRRLENEELLVRDAQSGPARSAVTERRIRIETVVEDVGVDSSGRQFPLGPGVDTDMAPGSVGQGAPRGAARCGRCQARS